MPQQHYAHRARRPATPTNARSRRSTAARSSRHGRGQYDDVQALGCSALLATDFLFRPGRVLNAVSVEANGVAEDTTSALDAVFSVFTLRGSELRGFTDKVDDAREELHPEDKMKARGEALKHHRAKLREAKRKRTKEARPQASAAAATPTAAATDVATALAAPVTPPHATAATSTAPTAATFTASPLASNAAPVTPAIPPPAAASGTGSTSPRSKAKKELIASVLARELEAGSTPHTARELALERPLAKQPAAKTKPEAKNESPPSGSKTEKKKRRARSRMAKTRQRLFG